MHTKLCPETLKRADHSIDLGVDGMIDLLIMMCSLHMAEIRNSHKIMSRNLEEGRPLDRPRCRWNDLLIMMG
jgi:hypothetical protein